MRRAALSLAGLLLAVTACSGPPTAERAPEPAVTPAAAAGPAGPGVRVAAVEPLLAAAQAGVREGDALVAWARRGGDGGIVAEGSLSDPFDLREAEIEQADRGRVRLHLRRGAAALAVELPPGPWGIEAEAPGVAGDATAAEAAARAADPSGPPGVAAHAARAAAWATLQAARELAASPHWQQAPAAFARARETAAAADAPWVEATVLEIAGEALVGRLPPAQERQLWEEAIARREAAGETLALARDQLFLARLEATRLGEMEAGRARLARSRELRRRLAPGSLAEAESLNGLAILASQSGDLEGAQALFAEAGAMIARVAPGGRAHAMAFNNLGLTLRRQGRLGEAERHLQRALVLHQRLDPESDHVAGTLNNLGVIARRRGRLAAAERYWARALALRRRQEPDGIGALRVMGNLANLAAMRGDLRQAEALHRETIAVLRRTAPRGEEMAITLSLLADDLLAAGRLDEAEAPLREAVELAEAELGETVLAANLQRRLAHLARRRGDVATARGLLAVACGRVARRAPQSLDEADCLAERAALASDGGDSERAAALLGDTLAIRRRWAPRSAAEAETLAAMAALAHHGGRAGEARELYLQALAALEAQQTELGGDDPARARFADKMAPVYRDAALLLVEMGKAAEAFVVLERYRARALVELVAVRDLLEEGLPAELAQRSAALRAASGEARERLARAASGADAAAVAELSARLGALDEERRRLAAEVRSAAPALADLHEPRPIGVAAAAASLPAGGFLISYVVGEERSAAVALRAGATGGQPQLSAAAIPAGRAELARRVEAYRALLQSPYATPAGGAALRRRGRELDHLLLGPFAGALAGATALVVLPDGPLHGLPFAALVEEDGRFLVARLPVTNAASATLRTRLPALRGRDAAALVLADPSPPRGERGLPRLPASRLEGHAAAGRLDAAELLTGEAATEQRVKRRGDWGVLHLAAHAVVDDRFPLESRLVLAPGGGDDGLLRSWEVVESVRCPGALVVLSACETAVGPTLGGEGMLGIARAFHLAGAASVVSSHWRVGDRSTAVLMERFYRALAGGASPAAALREAQLALLAAPVELPRAAGLGGGLRGWLGLVPAATVDARAPLHWAAFQAHGR